MGGPIPSLAPGNRSWTAWASTCAEECRMIASPSALPMLTGSTASLSASRHARSRSSPLTPAAITAWGGDRPGVWVLPVQCGTECQAVRSADGAGGVVASAIPAVEVRHERARIRVLAGGRVGSIHDLEAVAQVHGKGSVDGGPRRAPGV